MLEVLLLMTAIALAVVLGSAYMQLREASRQLALYRAELGSISVSDTEKVHAIALPTDTPNTWKWRLYLPAPPSGEYHVNCYVDREEVIAGKDPLAWLEKYRRAGPHWQMPKRENLELVGEITIEARLIKEDNHWRMSVHPIGDETVAVAGNWLDDPSKIEITNGISMGKTSNFLPGDPVMLLCIQDEPQMVSPRNGAFPIPNYVPPQWFSNTILLWIEKRP